MVLLAVDTTYMLPMTRNVSLRVYADSRPHNLEISALQKGLVLVFAGKELIEEGVGFGAPVVVFSDKTYFSATAHVTVEEKGERVEIVKRFSIDAVSRKRFKNGVFVDNPVYRFFSDSLASAYRDYPATRGMIFPLIRTRNAVGIKTFFTRAKPRGEITVTYNVKRRDIDVRVDFAKLDKRNCRKMLLLNEQGSTFFRKFSDSVGLNLIGSQIGAWDHVEADWACFSALDDSLGFCLSNVPNSRLFRGTEHVEGRLAWAGMGYELNPTTELSSYRIKMCGKEVG